MFVLNPTLLLFMVSGIAAPSWNGYSCHSVPPLQKSGELHVQNPHVRTILIHLRIIHTEASFTKAHSFSMAYGSSKRVLHFGPFPMLGQGRREGEGSSTAGARVAVLIWCLHPTCTTRHNLQHSFFNPLPAIPAQGKQHLCIHLVS